MRSASLICRTRRRWGAPGTPCRSVRRRGFGLWSVSVARARREGNRCAVAVPGDGDGHTPGDVERFGNLDDTRGWGEVGRAGTGGQRVHGHLEVVVRRDVESYGERRARRAAIGDHR